MKDSPVASPSPPPTSWNLADAVITGRSDDVTYCSTAAILDHSDIIEDTAAVLIDMTADADLIDFTGTALTNRSHGVASTPSAPAWIIFY